MNQHGQQLEDGFTPTLAEQRALQITNRALNGYLPARIILRVLQSKPKALYFALLGITPGPTGHQGAAQFLSLWGI